MSPEIASPTPRRPFFSARKSEAPQFSDEALLLTDAPVPGRLLLPPDAELETEVVTDASRLAALESDWEELADSAAEPNPFYEPWALLPAVRAYGKGAKLEVVVVSTLHRGQRVLCGLFPVVTRRGGRAELWKHRSCYLSTPLLRSGFAQAALRCLFDHLEKRTGVVRFADVPGDGPFHVALIDELNRRRWASLVPHWYTRALFRRATTSEEFLQRALNGKRRKELRRQRTRLAEQGRLELTELQPGDDPTPWLREFLEIEAKGWKGESGVAAAQHPAERTYIEEMTARAHRRGRLMMMALRLDGKAIALKHNLLAGEGSFAFKITFDESFARYSPGVLLELENIHRLHQLPNLRWMDSCAAPNRFMINHLWPDRRQMQTVFFATGRTLPSFMLALVPLFQLLRARLRRPKRRNS